MAPTKEAYMLPRTEQESKRLDAQHEYMRQMTYGHLIHPSIPAHQLNRVADVATGTGVWLLQLAEDPTLLKAVEGKRPEFVGFDISSEQFPPVETLPSNVALKVHDMSTPFPSEHHEKFDLVNVRLVSYAIKAVDLDKVVRNIIQILRPGGYLQWQETDASESWSQPETPTTTSCVNCVISEKIDRGLLPGIPGPLVKTILSYAVDIGAGQRNPISWSCDLMRLQHLETVSTFHHPSPAVEAGKKLAVMSAAIALLTARISRKKAELEGLSRSTSEAEKLSEEIESINNIMKAVESGNDANSSWDFNLTWIVARKAILLDTNKEWMSVKNPGL